jgi:hypothetical protein
MALDKQNLLNELSTAMKSNPDLYIGDLIEHVLDFSHPTRLQEHNYYNVVKIQENYPVTNSMLHDALVKYNNKQKRI